MARIDDKHLKFKVAQARDLIYQDNYAIDSAGVGRLCLFTFSEYWRLSMRVLCTNSIVGKPNMFCLSTWLPNALIAFDLFLLSGVMPLDNSLPIPLN